MFIGLFFLFSWKLFNERINRTERGETNLSSFSIIFAKSLFRITVVKVIFTFTKKEYQNSHTNIHKKRVSKFTIKKQSTYTRIMLSKHFLSIPRAFPYKLFLHVINTKSIVNI